MLAAVMQDSGSCLFIIQFIDRGYCRNIIGSTISAMRSIAIIIQQREIEKNTKVDKINIKVINETIITQLVPA